MTDHDHQPGDHAEIAFTPEFWDAFYAARDAVWSGNPNVRLVEHASDLAPGTALDVGAGEGADAIWLAARGWQVTAMDVSAVALARAAGHARMAGMADQVTVEQVDLLAEMPDDRRWDLVNAQFFQVPSDQRDAAYSRLAAAVAPGGTLLVVGHHVDMAADLPRSDMADLLFGPDAITALLAPDDWKVRVCDAPTREGTRPDGTAATWIDAVVVARRC